MSLLVAISATNEVLDFGVKIGELLSSEPGKKKKLKAAVDALGVIYFTPSGLISALKLLRDGAQPDDADVQAALLDFNQIEPEVHVAVRNLSFNVLSNSGLSLKQRRVLDEIAYGKLALRHSLQAALNETLTFGRSVELGLLDEFIEQIEAVNAKIEELDEMIGSYTS
jgi:hypothetical protein